MASEAVDQWPAWSGAMRHQGLAAGTITKRHTELAAWSAWIGERWQGATTWRDVEAWVASRPLGPRARASAVSHLRAFYRWARREGLTGADPCADVVCPRLHIGAPRPARESDVRRAVGAGTDTLELACALMAYAGLRCCEVARLHWPDVDQAAGVLYVRGKGGRDGVVPIAPPLAAILAAHDGVAGPVVAGHDGQRCTPARISQRVGAHLRARGATCTGHQLRHYAAMHVLERTRDITVVQGFLRHASIATTQVYAKASPAAVAAAVADW